MERVPQFSPVGFGVHIVVCAGVQAQVPHLHIGHIEAEGEVVVAEVVVVGQVCTEAEDD